MTLLDDFYHVSGHSLSDGTLHASLVFHPGHRIFEGHFPGQPVVPGVCMMHIVKELVEMFLAPGVKTRLVRADSAKFLIMINPLETPTVEAEVRYGPDEKVVARFYNGTTTFFKLTGLLKICG